MLNIDKEKLNKKYNEGDMEYFFHQAHKITDFVISRKYNNITDDQKEDMIQECLENLWKKKEQGKIDGSKNLMSFVWQNSTFRILEILRKQNNRNRIAKMVSFEEVFLDRVEKDLFDEGYENES